MKFQKIDTLEYDFICGGTAEPLLENGSIVHIKEKKTKKCIADYERDPNYSRMEILLMTSFVNLISVNYLCQRRMGYIFGK